MCVCVCWGRSWGKKEGQEGRPIACFYSPIGVVPRKVLGEQSYMNGTHGGRILLC